MVGLLPPPPKKGEERPIKMTLTRSKKIFSGPVYYIIRVFKIKLLTLR